MSLGAPLDRLARDAERFVDEWPAKGAAIIERSVQGELRSAPAGGRVPGVGTATVSVEAGAGEATVSGAGSMRVWAWCENGTRAHTIKGRPLLRTSYGPRPQVRVRGWRASHSWTNGVERADGPVIRDAEQRLDRLGR